MPSNSKLTFDQRDALQVMRSTQPHTNVLHFPDDNFTVVFKVLGKTVQFATAVCSPEEKRFRRKTGEFYARRRFGFDTYQSTAVLSITAFRHFVDAFDCAEPETLSKRDKAALRKIFGGQSW